MLNWHHFLKGTLMTDQQQNPPADQPPTQVDVSEVEPQPTGEPTAATAGDQDDPDTVRGDDTGTPSHAD